MPDVIDTAIVSLKQGLVIAYPTEAVFGLGCDPLNESAVQSLLDFKQRSVRKGLILIAGDFSLLAPFVDISDLSEEIFQKILATRQEPTTWVIPKSERCPAWISGEFDSVAVRISTHPTVRALSAGFNCPIVSTSANLAGKAPALNAKEVEGMFGLRLGAIVDQPLGNWDQPSRIFDALTGQQFR